MQTSWPASKPLLGFMIYGIPGRLQNIPRCKKSKIRYLGGCKKEPISKCNTAKAATATLQPTQRPTAIPHLEGKIRYIGAPLFGQLTYQASFMWRKYIESTESRFIAGLGSRGAIVLSRLMQHESLERAHVWYVDIEDKGPGPATIPNKILLQKVRSRWTACRQLAPL